MNDPLPDWISSRQGTVLQQVVGVLNEHELPYVISGGLAGNLYGSAWPLHDIDLDAPHEALVLLAERFARHVRWGPATYRDDEFSLELLVLELDGVTVEVNAAESVALVDESGGVVMHPTTLSHYCERPFLGLPLRVMPLEDLIAYKVRIGRAADVADLAALRATATAAR